MQHGTNCKTNIKPKEITRPSFFNKLTRLNNQINYFNIKEYSQSLEFTKIYILKLLIK